MNPRGGRPQRAPARGPLASGAAPPPLPPPRPASALRPPHLAARAWSTVRFKTPWQMALWVWLCVDGASYTVYGARKHYSFRLYSELTLSKSHAQERP